MPRLLPATTIIATALVAALVPTAAGASGGPSPTSLVDFGDCTELATGTVVALSELEERVPDDVAVLSMTDQGFVFPGSDDLGVLIIRTLECDSITVTHDGRTSTQLNRHIAQVGTRFDTSDLPASPFNNDGGNGADFNNYTLAYYSDSSIYRNAMRRAGVQPIAPARIDIDDLTIDDCVVDRTVTVQPSTTSETNYGFTATGIVPAAACEPAVVPFIGNWWSVENGEASVLSNVIPGQAAVFIDPTETVVTYEAAHNSQLADVFGADSANADAFGVIGFIPEADGTDMVITNAG